MRFLHLTEDAAGVSHFADGEIALQSGDFAPPAPRVMASAIEACARFLYLLLPPGWDGPQHRAPHRQVAFCLAGRLRVVAGDGESREIGPGSIWRIEDTTGSGHTTTVVGDRDVELAIVQLE